MLFGYVDFSIVGYNYNRLYKKIIVDKLPCRNIRENKGMLSFRVSAEYSQTIKDLCQRLDLDYEVKKKKGLFTLYSRLKKHIGILIGVLVFLIICFVLSNMLLRINILSDNATIKNDVIAVLKENDSYTGSFIPEINCVQLERELKQKVDGISWAGISLSGSTLTVDVIESIKAPESNSKRLPSNIIAKRDAVIDKIDVLDGQLETSIGSGVLKGDKLVSGVITTEKKKVKDGKEVYESYSRYVRSLAKIYGTFQETITIYQPYKDQTKTVSDKTKTKTYLRLFDAEIPMFLSFPKGNFTSESTLKRFSLLGFELPVSLKKVKLNEISFHNNVLSREEARLQVYKKLKKYEANFYKDYEIKDKKIEEKSDKNGVTLTVNYKLYGDICEENEFFIPK